MADIDYLRSFMSEDDINDCNPDNPVWREHHGFGAWMTDTWVRKPEAEYYFGGYTDTEDLCNKTRFVQAMGYRSLFEEMRKQWPHCSMALNWCLDEPWINVGGPTVTTYPGAPKPGYYALKDALRPVVASACMPKFRWYSGEMFRAELWMLNNSLSSVFDEVRVFLQIGGEKQPILKWETGRVPEQSNRRGHLIQLRLPETDTQTEFTLILESLHGTSSYRLPLLPKKKLAYDPHALNV
jgi:beta-mannosidase